MTLPSQAARTSPRYLHTYRRRRPSKLFYMGVAAVGFLVVFGIWKLFTGGEGDALEQDLVAVADVDAQHVREPAIEQDRPANGPLARDAQPRTTEPPRSTQTPQRSASQSQQQSSQQQREPEIRMGERISAGSSTPSRVPATGVKSDTQSSPPQDERPARTSQPQSATPAPQSEPRPSSSQPLTPAHQRANERVNIGMELLASNRPIEARVALTRALDSGVLDAATAQRVRDTLRELNDRLVFSPEIVEGDPYAFGYTIRPGDALSRLPRGQNLATDWRLIQRINRISRPEAIRAGQRIKLVTGPFHAVVYKRQFRLDLYMGDGAERVFVRSFIVGLGEYDSTPVGTFKVRPHSKLINPEWVNPRTGERFLPDDPANPIGEHWIGLLGVSEGVRDLGGYGIHGTIEPQTIGKQASMGCIRMFAEDVELIYELLVEEHSTIEIVDR